MKPKLLIILLLIVLAPLALLAWLSFRVARDEMVRHKYQQLLTAQLKDVDATILNVVGDRQRQLLQATELLSYDAEALRELTRKISQVTQIFVLAPDGKRLHPPLGGPLSESEQEFLERAGQVWKDHQHFFDAPTTTVSPRATVGMCGFGAATSI